MHHLLGGGGDAGAAVHAAQNRKAGGITDLRLDLLAQITLPHIDEVVVASVQIGGGVDIGQLREGGQGADALRIHIADAVGHALQQRLSGAQLCAAIQIAGDAAVGVLLHQFTELVGGLIQQVALRGIDCHNPVGGVAAVLRRAGVTGAAGVGGAAVPTAASQQGGCHDKRKNQTRNPFHTRFLSSMEFYFEFIFYQNEFFIFIIEFILSFVNGKFLFRMIFSQMHKIRFLFR